MRFYLVAAVPAALFICISSNKEICDGSVASSLLSLTSQLKKRRSLSPPRVICHRSIDRPCLQGIWVTLRVSLSDLLTMLCFFLVFFFFFVSGVHGLSTFLPELLNMRNFL